VRDIMKNTGCFIVVSYLVTMIFTSSKAMELPIEIGILRRQAEHQAPKASHVSFTQDPADMYICLMTHSASESVSGDLKRTQAFGQCAKYQHSNHVAVNLKKLAAFLGLQ
jgi:hypothetical protein